MRVARNETLTDEQRACVLQELARVLESEFFRASQRCCHFLEYCVHFVLEGRPQEELKERIIGVEVFRKPGNYDTAQDNVVRVTANEVRKRLAQYYDHDQRVHNPSFQLQSGSYAVTFRWTQEEAISLPAFLEASETTIQPEPVLLEQTHPAANLPRRRFEIRHRVAAAVLLALGLILTAIAYRILRTPDTVQGVWYPILQSPRVAVICIAQPVAYRPKSNMDVPVNSQDTMLPMPDAFVGMGDAYALADIARVLSNRGKEWQLLAGNSTPSQTLRDGPIVLIGDHSNKWTSALTENLRFYFGIDNGIYDRSNPGSKWSLDHLTPDWKTSEDYAIASRFTSPETGQPVVLIAGLTNFGTQAAGEFFTNQSLLTEALQKAPKDWEHKNFQFVLHTKIIGNTPERPIVVASYFW
jgi:hypothetical protein